VFTDRRGDALTPLTNKELASLGGGRLAYVKAMRSEDVNRVFPEAPALQPGVTLFALVAADGSPIAVTMSRDAAVASALAHELETVSVH
jgi:hypothetical protein